VENILFSGTALYFLQHENIFLKTWLNMLCNSLISVGWNS
jgi:hypothetical protein